MRIILFLVALLAPGSLFAGGAIAVQPLGKLKAERLAVVKQALKEAFGVDAEILAAKPLPKEAWYAPRGRWRADRLLESLGTGTPADFKVVVGIASADISTTKGEHADWGVFGLGELGGRTCVVSTFRLGARGADEAKLRDRLRKVVIHEVGHVIGLDHCPQAGCVMRDAESSIATVDAETGKFCGECAKAVAGWRVVP